MPLKSWSEVTLDTAPLGWPTVEESNSLCDVCGGNHVRVREIASGDRMCLDCAQNYLGLRPDEVTLVEAQDGAA